MSVADECEWQLYGPYIIWNFTSLEIQNFDRFWSQTMAKLTCLHSTYGILWKIQYIKQMKPIHFSFA